MICNNLIISHLLLLFKEMQLFYILTEYLRYFYELDERNIHLRNICDLYDSFSKNFYDYFALPEKDFTFKNIKKIIDKKIKKKYQMITKELMMNFLVKK